MIEGTRSEDLTVRDVLNGLESMERWTRQLREALATLDHEQRLDIQPRVAAGVPRVSGGQCPSPDDDKAKPRGPKKPKKKPKKKKK